MSAPAVSPADLRAGARNLLVHCGGFSDGDAVLVVHEDPALGWYDQAVADAVVMAAKEIGAHATVFPVGGPDQPVPDALGARAAEYDGVVYLARIGDQDRFAPRTSAKPVVMSYARDADALASAYGRTDHGALMALKGAVDALLFGSQSIEIACPLGTEVTGTVTPDRRQEGGEVTVRRFPMGVPQPMPAATFQGRVALARCLTPTGSRSYEPASLMLDDVVFALISAGRIVGFEGDPRTVRAIEDHYAHVAGLFGIDAGVVHSWHAGVHPAAAFAGRLEDDPDRWSNSIFTSPRFLHFHTCGAYAPGEICWMVLDPTIRLDGRALWLDGQLRGHAAGLAPVLDDWPVLRGLLADPTMQVGIAPDDPTAVQATNEPTRERHHG